MWIEEEEEEVEKCGGESEEEDGALKPGDPCWYFTSKTRWKEAWVQAVHADGSLALDAKPLVDKRWVQGRRKNSVWRGGRGANQLFW